MIWLRVSLVILVLCVFASISLSDSSTLSKEKDFESSGQNGPVLDHGEIHKRTKRTILEVGYARKWWGCLFSMISNPGCFRELKNARRSYMKSLEINTPIVALTRLFNRFLSQPSNSNTNANNDAEDLSTSRQFDSSSGPVNWTFYNETDIINPDGFPPSSIDSTTSTTTSTEKNSILFSRSNKPAWLRNLKQFVQRIFPIRGNNNNNLS